MIPAKRSSARPPSPNEAQKKNLGWLGFLVLDLVVLGSVIVLFLVRNYPLVGHDYRGVVPLFLDIVTFVRKNGLSIQWYTPAFGGGFPVFPDPNSGQFSLITLLSLVFHPFEAVIITALIDIAAGLGATYYLCSRVLKFHWTTSVLGAIFFSANGFIIQRVAVGHYAYIIFPVTVVLLVLLIDSSIPWKIAGLLFSLVVTMMIHQAGYYSLLIFGFSLLLTLPILYIKDPSIFSWKRMVFVALSGGGLAMLMVASKIAAIFSFMRFFPRQIADSYHTTALKGILGILMQLLGTMNLSAVIKAIGGVATDLPRYMIAASGAQYGYWEFDMSLSPVVFVILILGSYQFIRKPGKRLPWFSAQKKWLAWLLLVIFTWLTVEFILAKGLVYPLLQKLPILSSMHVNVRYTAALIFPLALCAAIVYDHWSRRLPGRKLWLWFILVNILTLLPLGTYLLIGSDLQSRIYDLTASNEIYSLIRSGDPMTITAIDPGADNTQAMLLHQSNLQTYEPIFGYQLENFHPEIKAGSIWNISDGYYNLTNPTGYVYPEVNGSRAFERIPVAEKAQLEAFANYEQPAWKLPLYQQVLDWVSGLTVLVVAAILAWLGIRKLIKVRVSKAI